VWVLSGKDLAPLYAIAPELGDRDRLVSAGSATETAYAGIAGPGDIVAATGAVLPADPGVEWDDVRYLIDPRAGMRRLAAPPESAEPESSASLSAAYWQRVALIGPGHRGWGDGYSWSTGSQPDFLELRASKPVLEKYPTLERVQICADIDGDGVLDWLALGRNPCSVFLVSGSDLRILRTIPMSSHPFATVATGGFEVGDIDGDGVHDWVLGGQVSQSEDRETSRMCRLGILSLVSGIDLHVIGTLERSSFLDGPASQCPVVRLPRPLEM
jgi:hypothetical protein